MLGLCSLSIIACLVVISPSIHASPFAQETQSERAVDSGHHSADQTTDSVERFDVFELVLTASNVYTNPYQQGAVQAEISGPIGSAMVPGFWDGDGTWKVRFAPSTVGDYSYVTSSSDPGLVASGSFTCVPSSRRGGVTAKEDSRLHFQYEDGTPLWWFGETCWAAFRSDASENLNHQTFLDYIDVRAAQGFNYLHGDLLGGANEGGEPFMGEVGDQVNPAFWQEVDSRVAYMNSKGITAGLMLAWKDDREVVSPNWVDFPDQESRIRYCGYVAARYCAYDVAWVLSGEYNETPYLEPNSDAHWQELADAVRQGDPNNRMMAIHGTGQVENFAEEEWMSFGDYMQAADDLHALILNARDHYKPVVNSEYCYFLHDRDLNGVPDPSCGASIETWRHASWDIAMAGGYLVTGFGTTYLGGVRDPGPFNVHAPQNDPAEQQLPYIKTFFSLVEWWNFVPGDGLINGGGVQYCLHNFGGTYLVYVRGTSQPVQLTLLNPGVNEYGIRRFDPRAGSWADLPPQVTGSPLQLTTPDDKDWAFLVTNQGPGAFALISPNGGENWLAGSSHVVTWNVGVAIQNVALDFSADNGQSWQTIVASTPNDGSYNWNVFNIISENCRIRISDAADADPTDVSDGVFSIINAGSAGQALRFDAVDDQALIADNDLLSGGPGKSITVEAWVKPQVVLGHHQVISKFLNTNSKDWGLEVEDGRLVVDIENNGDDWLYTDGSVLPSVWSHIAFTFDNAQNMVRLYVNGIEAGPGAPLPKDMPDSQAPVLLGSHPYYSDHLFLGTIDEVRIWNYPRSAAQLQADMNRLLPGNETGLVAYWPLDEGTGQTTADRTGNGNHAVLGSTTESEINDPVWVASDAPIGSPGFIHVTSPNGGEDWQVGSNQQITWSATGSSGNVKIEFSTNSGANWSTITANTPDDGSFTWIIPNNPSSNCLVKVMDVDGSPADQSDAVFTISAVPIVLVTFPNGGEDLQVGSAREITWTASGSSGNVKIEFSTNGGGDWSAVIASTPDDGAFSWNIPNNPSSNCLVRVMDVDGSPADQSDAVFTISAVPTPLAFRIERSTGDVFTEGSFIGGGADLAELIQVSEPVKPGDVVELDPDNPQYYRKARGPGKLIAGVIATNPGFTLGNNPDKDTPLTATAPNLPTLVLMGRVPVKVSTENGPIQPGDLLTISSKPGYAKRANTRDAKGAIIGKALEGLSKGTGQVLVLVMVY